MKKVIIIGAGPAGLTAGYDILSKSSDYEVTIIEETPYVGGLCARNENDDISFDAGGHMYISENPKINKLWNAVLPMQGSPSKDDLTLDRYCKISNGGPNPNQVDDVFLSREKITKIYKDGKFYDNPVKLNKEAVKNMGLSTSLKSGFSQIGGSVFKRKEKSLEDYCINRYGKELYNMFLEDYIDKVWGKHPDRIFSEWGDIACKDMIAPVISVDKNSSRSNKTDAPHALRYYYPKFGAYQLWESCADRFIEMGGSVHKNCKVTGIYQANGKIMNVKCYADGDEFNVPCDYLISTMPLRDLVLSMNDIDGRTHLAAENLCYRGLVSVNVELSDILWKNNDSNIKTINNITGDSIIYIDNPNVKVARIQVYNNFTPYLTKDDHYVTLGLNYYCNEGDYYWNLNDRDFRKLVEGELIKLGIIRNNQWILKYSSVRFNKAFPCYYDGYENVEELKKFVDGFENLYCIGRNGQHRFSNVEQAMNTSFECVKNILNNTKSKENVWTVNDCNDTPDSEKLYNSALLSGEGEYRGNYVPVQKNIENRDENAEYVPPRRMRRPMMTPIKKADPEEKLSEAIVLDNSVVIAARPGVSIPIDPNMEPVIPMNMESRSKETSAETEGESTVVSEPSKNNDVHEVSKPPAAETVNEPVKSDAPKPMPRIPRARRVFSPVRKEESKDTSDSTDTLKEDISESVIENDTIALGQNDIAEESKDVASPVARVPEMPKAAGPASKETDETRKIPTMEEVKESLIFSNASEKEVLTNSNNIPSYSNNAPSYKTVNEWGVAVVEPFEDKVKDKVEKIKSDNEKTAPKKIESDMDVQNANSVKISKVVDRAGSALVTNQNGPKIEYDYMSTKNAFSKKTDFGNEDRFNEEASSKLKKPTGPIPEFAKVQTFKSDFECDNSMSIQGEKVITRDKAHANSSSTPVAFTKIEKFEEGADVDKVNPHERVIQKEENASKRVGLKRASSFVDAADVNVIERPNAREDMLKELHGEGEVDELGLGGFGLNKPEKTKLRFGDVKAESSVEDKTVVDDTVEEVKDIVEVAEAVETTEEYVDETVEYTAEHVEEVTESFEETVELAEDTNVSYDDIEEFEVQSDYAHELSEQYVYAEPVTYADDISDIGSSRDYDEDAVSLTNETVEETVEESLEESLGETVEEPVEEPFEDTAKEYKTSEEVISESTDELITEEQNDEIVIEEDVEVTDIDTSEETIADTANESVSEDSEIDSVAEEISSADQEAYEELLEYDAENDAEIVDYNVKTDEIVEEAKEEDDDNLSKINEQAASRAIVKPWSSKYHGSAEPEVRETFENNTEDKISSRNINEAHNFFGNTGVDNYPRVRLNNDGELEKKEEQKAEQKEEKKDSGMHIIKESNPNSLVGATDRFSTELIKRDVIEEDEGFTIDRGPIPLKKKPKHKFNPFFGKKDKPAKGGVSLVEEPATVSSSDHELTNSVLKTSVEQNTAEQKSIEHKTFEQETVEQKVVESKIRKSVKVPVLQETYIQNEESEEVVFELPKFVKSFRDKPSVEKSPEEKAVDDLIASDVLDDNYVDEKFTVENILSDTNDGEVAAKELFEKEADNLERAETFENADASEAFADTANDDITENSEASEENEAETHEESKSAEEQFDEFMAQLDEELGLSPVKSVPVNSESAVENIIEKKPEVISETVIDKKLESVSENAINDTVSNENKEEPRVDSFVNATISDFNEVKQSSEPKANTSTESTPKASAPVYKEKPDYFKKDIDTSIVFKNAKVIKTTKISHMKDEEPQEIKREKVFSDKERVIAVIKNGEYIPVMETVEEKETPQEKKPSSGKSKQSRKKRKNNKSSNKPKESEEDYVGTPISVMLDAKEAAKMQAPLENPIRRDRNSYKHD